MKTIFFTLILSSTCLAEDEYITRARQSFNEYKIRSERIYEFSKTERGEEKEQKELQERQKRMQREAYYKAQERARTIIPIYYYPVYVAVPIRTTRFYYSYSRSHIGFR